MPLDYRIDHTRRLVIAIGRGTLTDGEVFGYQREIWSRPDVAGYNELVDMTNVTDVEMPSGNRLRNLAQLSARMDTAAARSRFAIVAPSDIAFGLGRQFQSYRGLMNKGTKYLPTNLAVP